MEKSNNQTVRRIRGSAVFGDDGDFEFRPDGQGESRQQLITKAGKSRLYRTTGEKQQSLVAHLSVPSDSSDPCDDLRSDLERMLATQPGYRKPATPRGRVLREEPFGKICLNRSAGTIECSFAISLMEHPDYMKQFYNLTHSIAQCLYYNTDSIVQLSRVLARRGK